jgi:hypothetical protein
MTQFKITYGVGGGYNVKDTEIIEANTLDEATEIAYLSAIEVFERYGVFGRQYPDYDYDSVSEEDYELEYNEELERWVRYNAEPV